MSISVYTWNIPESWKQGLNPVIKEKAQKKLGELNKLVNQTLRADPSKGVTIDQALKSRRLQQLQIREIEDLLSHPVDENVKTYLQNKSFFTDKICHETQEIMDVYLKIVEVGAKRPQYKQMQIIKLLKAYEQFVANPKNTAADRNYNKQKELEFFERVLTAVLHTDRFDIEFDWIKKALTNGEKEQYSITASKIMTKVNNAIDGSAVEKSLENGFSMSDYTRLTTVDYKKLADNLKPWQQRSIL